MKFEKTEVWGFEHAIRGMRNPLESWDRSDSNVVECPPMRCKNCPYKNTTNCNKINPFLLGHHDIELAQKLIKGGPEHRKFMRQIMVSVDITAPLYWWKEFDTYKVGTVANSTSTMHKLASTPITMDCFEMGDFEDVSDLDTFGFVSDWWDNNIYYLEQLRQKYNETKDKRYWKELIRLLPESWLQTRTVTLNYENLLSIVKQRSQHKLSEWSIYFIDWVKTLPYTEELLFLED